MSQTSCVRHPAGARFLKIYQWQLDFCDGDACAAALMSYFEFCHNGKLQQLEQAKTLNDALEQVPEGQGRTQVETLLQWHTTAELEKAVFFYKRDKIAQAVKLLKLKEVIEVRSNPNPKLWFDRTQHFLFKPAKVNAWIDSHFPTQPDSIVEKPEMPGETPVNDPPSPSIVEKSEMQTRETENGLRKSDDGCRKIGNVLEQRILTKNTDKETTTTRPEAPQAKGRTRVTAAPSSLSSVALASEEPSGELSAQDRLELDTIADAFGSDGRQRAKAVACAKRRGMPFVLEQADIVRTKPNIRNLAGAFEKACDSPEGWKRPKPAATKKPKPSKPDSKPEEPPPAQNPDYSSVRDAWLQASEDQRDLWRRDAQIRHFEPKPGKTPGYAFLVRLHQLIGLAHQAAGAAAALASPQQPEEAAA